MALTETTKVDQIEVLENCTLQIRTATIIEKDGQELTRTFFRTTKTPGEDVSNEDTKVQAIANAIWTPEVIAEYEQYVASLTNGIN
jgi:hypothetical protein